MGAAQLGCRLKYAYLPFFNNFNLLLKRKQVKISKNVQKMLLTNTGSHPNADFAPFLLLHVHHYFFV